MKKLLLAAVLALTALASAASDSTFKPNVTTLLSAAIATGAGPGFEPSNAIRTFSASGATTAGAGAATIKIQGSNVASPSVDGDWVDLGTITLTLATTKSADGFVSLAPWRLIRANVTGISGTNASVDVLMGY
jgi:hypothetical protein